MIDFKENEINVGDKIVYIDPMTNYLREGIVSEATPKGATVIAKKLNHFTGEYYDRKISRTSGQFIKLSDADAAH